MKIRWAAQVTLPLTKNISWLLCFALDKSPINSMCDVTVRYYKTWHFIARLLHLWHLSLTELSTSFTFLNMADNKKLPFKVGRLISMSYSVLVSIIDCMILQCFVLIRRGYSTPRPASTLPTLIGLVFHIFDYLSFRQVFVTLWYFSWHRVGRMGT